MIPSSARQRLLIVGSQGHAKVVAEIASSAPDVEVIGFVDDFRPIGTSVLSWEIIGSISDVLSGQLERFDKVFVAVGDNDSREAIVTRLKCLPQSYLTLRHPSATISPSANIGMGTIIMPHVVISAEARLGDHVVVNTGAIVEHECVIEDYCSIAPNACLAGQVILRRGTAVCMGAHIREKLEVGAHATVGAGSTVLQSVPSFSITYGTPARHIRHRVLGEKHLH